MSRHMRTGSGARAVQAALRALSTEIERLDSLAAERFGLNRTDLRCLDVLGRVGALTPTELARALGFTTGGVTTVIDRLEQAGYARRRPDPADRRRIIVEPTELVVEREAAIFGGLIKSIESLGASYSDAELATILDFLGRGRELVAGHVALLMAQPPGGRRAVGPRSPVRNAGTP